MDIPDIEIVVVFGVPDTVSHPCCEVHLYHMQLCGRADRSGCQARAHLFYMTKKISDVVLQQYCAFKNTENC